ncbi:MAG: branched-chain amino acid transaminase [Ignavibacteriales bacterium]|nr:branched-chain amino acid transaminase [Ignavibacteriales bacterium]
MSLPNYAFFKDKIVPYSEAKVGVLTHGLNYGTGVFGGIRGYWNDIEKDLFVFRPLDHFQRFLESTRLLRMELSFTREEITAILMDLIRKEDLREDVYVRPLAFYGDEIIGVRLHNVTPILSISVLPFGRYIEKEEGAHVMFSSWRRIDDNVIPARGKITGGYVNSALAKSDANLAGFDEAILLNQDGHISEGSAENIFIYRKGKIVTPPVTDNILEGITRNTMMALLRDELGMEVVERPIDRTEVYLSDEVFMVATGAQIVAITRIDHRKLGSGTMGPVTLKLRDLYFNVVRGKVPKYRHWCQPVYGNK